MPFDPRLSLGEVVDNRRLASIFKCSTQSGMRRSRETGTLVLISDPRSVYGDRWVGDILRYTGQGLVGDQQMTRMNRVLSETSVNGVQVFLFEVFRDNEYTFLGPVEVAELPYQDQQRDKTGAMRSVWMFPLRMLSGAAIVAHDALIEALEARQAETRSMSDEELADRAVRAPKYPTRRRAVTTVFLRDEHVAGLALRRARGICQLCSMPAPFKKRSGAPYLEVHHIKWLSKGGTDSIENTVALCPNCHRKMHSQNKKADQDRLRLVAQQAAAPRR